MLEQRRYKPLPVIRVEENIEIPETKNNSRKMFLKLLGGAIISLPFVTKLASANLYLRKEDGTTIDFNDLFRTNTAIKTSDYSMVDDDYLILINGSSNTVTITLPSAVGNKGKVFNIKCIDDSYDCDISTTGGQEIDGSTDNFQIYKDEVLSLQSDDINWWVI